MELRKQLGIVSVVLGAWMASTWVRVHPLMDKTTRAERMSLATLETTVARDPSDALSTRVLLRRYLDQGMPTLVVSTVEHSPETVQRDGTVSLVTARAQESLGHVAAAKALVTGALARCTTLPEDLLDGAGCDVRTQTSLAMESTALDHMTQWNITPVTDPARASIAHEIATRPVRISNRLSDSL